MAESPSHEVERLRQALAGVVRPEFVDSWLNRPNPAFDGRTPLELVKQGDSDRVWAVVHDLASGNPG